MVIANVVSMSGGKDSTAVAVLALLTQPRETLQFVFADTGNEHELTYEYLGYLEQALDIEIHRLKRDFSSEIAGKREYVLTHWAGKGVQQEAIDRAAAALVPTGIPYLDLCLWKGRFPSTKTPFCTQKLKTEPLTEYALNIIDSGEAEAVWSWQGVRLDESHSRRSRLQGTGACVKAFDERGGGIYNYRPILRWSAADCFEAHRYVGIKPNPLYKQGMSRVGCMPCINAGKDEVRAISSRYPQHVQRIAEWELAVGLASKRGNSTFFPAPGDNDTAYQRGNVWKVVEWSKTSRGGKQYDFLLTEEPKACESAYGLCE